MLRHLEQQNDLTEAERLKTSKSILMEDAVLLENSQACGASAAADGTAFVPVPLTPARIPSLDGLRAVSIVLVFLAHLADTRGAPRLFDHFVHVGNLGVRVFFVISGFLITKILLKEMSKTGGISLKRFYLRRVLRIFPAFYVYVAVIAVLHLAGLIAVPAKDFLYAITYIVNYNDQRAWHLNHLWSLAVEEQFYLLWPVLLCVLRQRTALICAAGVVFLAPVVRALMWYQWHAHPSAMTRHFEAVADSLAIGCLLAGSYNWLGQRHRYVAFLSSRFFLLAPAVGLLLALSSTALSRGLYYVVGQSIANISIALCIDRYVRFPTTLGGRTLNSRPFVVVGILSYSLYLWQEPFLDPTTSIVSFYTGFPQNIGLAIVAASMSYYLVERPFLRLKRKIDPSAI